MTDEELIAEARRMSPAYRHGGSDRDKSVGWVLLELAARLEARPVPDREKSLAEFLKCRNCGEEIRRVQPGDGIDPRDYEWVHFYWTAAGTEVTGPICDGTMVAGPPDGAG